jgi:hypothetical protein
MVDAVARHVPAHRAQLFAMELQKLYIARALKDSDVQQKMRNLGKEVSVQYIGQIRTGSSTPAVEFCEILVQSLLLDATEKRSLWRALALDHGYQI